MGKAISGIASSVINDRGIAKAVGKGQAGYKNAAETLGKGKAEALGYLEPYRELGGTGLSSLAGLLTGKQYNAETGEMSNLTPEQRLALFTQSPDYQFRLQQGLNATEASQAARGGLLSGRAALEINRQAQGEASSEYGNFINRLEGLAGIGQIAATQSGAITGDVASQQAGINIGTGNLAMQGTLARYQNWGDLSALLGKEAFGSGSTPQTNPSQAGGAGQSAAGAGGGAGQLASLLPLLFGGGASGAAVAFSDTRLKENTKLVGEENGFNIYEFNYKGQPERYRGVIAQEVQAIKPEAVIEKDGFLLVDYDKLGIKFREV